MKVDVVPEPSVHKYSNDIELTHKDEGFNVVEII